MTPILAFPNPEFIPAMRIIQNITQAENAEVTTTFAHGYLSGLIVRINIGTGDGMKQIDTQTGTITVTGLTTFLIDINTATYEPFFIADVPHKSFYSIVVPIGEINSILTQATQNTL
jgi:hypothetical protein